jgi:hypothetical protein
LRAERAPSFPTRRVGVLVLLEGEAPAVRVLSRTKELSGRVGAADARYALFAAASVARRLVSLGGPVTQEQLVEWVSREGGPIHFTPLRSVVVEALEQTVEDLFARLVEVGGGRGAARRLAAPDLEPAFSPLVAAAKVVRDPPVIVPVTGKRIHVPFAYLNGEYHMVKPQAFTRTMDAALASASHLGVQGRLLREHVRVEGRRLKLTVVGSFSSTSVRGAVEDLLGQFETRLWTQRSPPRATWACRAGSCASTCGWRAVASSSRSSARSRARASGALSRICSASSRRAW